MNPSPIAGGPAALVLVWLAAAVVAGSDIWFDAPVRNAVHSLASPGMTLLMRGASAIGASYGLILLGAVIVLRWRRALWPLAASALGGELLSELAKVVFHRPRPEVFFGLTPLSTYSFPSGHAAAAVCFGGALVLVFARRCPAAWAGAVAAALLIGTSRVYLGMHYPSDVLAGWALGTVWLSALAWKSNVFPAEAVRHSGTIPGTRT